MNNEEKILKMLEQLQRGQAATNARLDTMQCDISTLKEDVEQIKEDTIVIREVVNGISEWVEVASDVLKIKYPVKE